MTDLVVPARFCGPPGSGNGGWTAGALASLLVGDPLGRTVRVTLRRPPPLDTPLPVRDGTALAPDGGAVAVGEVVDEPLTTVPAVGSAAAAAASSAYAGWRSHPFPTCFACGTGREEGDGLRIFPGPVEGRTGTVAAPWTPAASCAEDWHDYSGAVRRASLAVAWAALDCVGGWTSDLDARPLVLGRMTARVDTLPVVGEPHVVVGEARGTEGRKCFTAATLRTADGDLVGTAEHVWIAIDPATFGS